MTYSVWVRESMTVMRRWDRSFNTKQAANQAARRQGLIAFHVLRDPDTLPLAPPKRAHKSRAQSR